MSKNEKEELLAEIERLKSKIEEMKSSGSKDVHEEDSSLGFDILNSRSTTFLKMILDLSPEIISYVDKNMKFRFANHKYQELFGKNPIELKGKELGEVLGKEGFNKIKPYLKKSLEGVAQEYETSFHSPNGELKYFRARYIPHMDKSSVLGTLNIVQDITEQKVLTEALAKSEYKYRSIIEGVMDGCTIFNMDGKILEVNEAYSNMIGYSGDELIGMSWKDIDVVEKPEDVAKHIAEIKLHGSDIFETKHRKKDGKIIIIEVSVRIFDQKKEYFVNFLRDITKQKIHEKKIKEERDKAQKYLDIAGVILVVLDATGKVILLNKKGCEILGYEIEEIVDKNWFVNFLPKNIYSDVKAGFDELIAGNIEVAEYFENRILTKDGEERIIAWHNTLLRNDNGEIKGTLSSGEDITERIKALSELDENRSFLNSILVNSQVGIFVIDVLDEKKYLYKYINPTLENMSGIKAEEIVGKSPEELRQFFDDESVSQFYDLYDECREKKITIEKEHRFISGDEEIWWLKKIAPVLNEDGIVMQLVGNASVITDRKRTKTKLEESIERYHSLFEDSPIPLWEEDFTELNDGLEELKKKGIKDFRKFFDENPQQVEILAQKVKILDVNEATLQLHDAKSKEELIGNLSKLFTENSYKVFKEEIIAIANGDSEFEIEGEVKTLLGEKKHVNLKLKIDEPGHGKLRKALLATNDITEQKISEVKLQNQIVKSEEQRIATLSVLADLNETTKELQNENTERKIAEKALLESESRLIEAQGIAKLGYYDFNLAEDKWQNSGELDEIFGINENYKRDSTGWLNIVHPDYREQMSTYLTDIVIAQNQKFDKEYYIVNQETGEEKWVHGLGYLNHDEKNNPIEMFGTIQDVTERKQATEELNEREKRLSILYANVNEVIFYLNVFDGDKYLFHSVNPAFLKSTGLDENQVVGKSVNDVIPEPSLSLVLSKYNKAVQTKTTVRWEEITSYPSGDKVGDVTITPIFDVEGNCTNLIGTVYDITDRKHAEEKIKKESLRNQLILDTTLDSYILANHSGEIIDVNPSYCKIIDYSRDELVKMNIRALEVEIPEEEVERRINEMINQGSDRFETKHKRKNGSIIDFDVSMNVMRIDEEPLVVAFMRDVTESKLAELEIKNSRIQLRELVQHMNNLQETERIKISREIHDIVGQALTGLNLDLVWIRNKLGLTDDQVNNKFEDMVKLIDETTQATQKISAELRPGLLDEVGLRYAIEYLLKDFSVRTGVKTEIIVEPEDCTFGEELGVTMYRITQEALTNIARHAEASKVQVVLKKSTGTAKLIIQDNGIGIRQHEINHPDSLGLLGMKERVLAQNGELLIDGIENEGTIIEITFNNLTEIL